MGRKPSWPPNSAAEWIVGQNFRSWDRKPSSERNTILKVELSENEASGDETLAITYPRRRNRSGPAKTASLVEGPSSSRKVRFESPGEPRKSAFKKNGGDNDSEETLVDKAEDQDGAPAEQQDSSSVVETDTSEEELSPKCKKKGGSKRRSRRPKFDVCLKYAAAQHSSAFNGAIPHSTCPCPECKKGRMIMRAVIKAEAKLRAGNEKAKNKQQAEESSEAVESTETEVDTAESDSTKEEPQKSKKARKKKNKKKGQSSTAQDTEVGPPETGLPNIAVDKNAFRFPAYPKELRPNLILPTRARVVQVEHAVESPNDPAPNAFFDIKKGVTRVYHGPRWGNHDSQLYENVGSAEMKQDPGNHAPPPPAPPPPASTLPFAPPWQAGYPPPYWMPPPPTGPPVFPWTKTATAAPEPLPKDPLKEAAAKGLGLSDLPVPKAPSPPPEWPGVTHRTSSPKDDPDKDSKKDGWNDPPPKEANPMSPFDFTGFGLDNGEKFSRKSKSSGSKKTASVDGRKKAGSAQSGGWRDKKNDDGQGNGAWAASNSSNKDKNDGWKASGSKGDKAWGNNQPTDWGKGDQSGDNSWETNKATAWADDGKSGDNAWGNNHNTNNWGNGSTSARSQKASQQGDEANASKARSNSGDSGLGQGLFALPDGFAPNNNNNGPAKMPGAMPDSGANAGWGGGGGGQW